MTANRGVPPLAGGGTGNQQQADQQTEYIGVVGALRASPEAEPATGPPDPRDWVRAVTNFSFLGIFALTIILSFCAAIWRGSDWTNVKDLLQLLLPAETALLGSAVGFYFGSQTNAPGR